MNIKDAEQVFNDLRLDFPETDFAPDKGFAIVEYNNVGSLTRPYKSSKINTLVLPQTKTGMTGAKDKIIPEYYLDNLTELNEGSILTVFDSKGTPIKKYKLNKLGQ